MAKFEDQVITAAIRYYPVAFAILRNEADADDAIQSAAARALERRRSLRNPDRFDAWFKTILKNLAFDVLRNRVSKGFTTLDENVPDREPDIDRLLDLRDAIDSLPHHRRQILLLSATGLSRAEIAEVLGVPEGTARRQVSEAYSLIRARMKRGNDLEGSVAR